MKYRKIATVDAFCLLDKDVPDWFKDKVADGTAMLNKDGTADIFTLEGVHHALVDDFIIRGVKGEIYPCKHDIFLSTYEEVSKG